MAEEALKKLEEQLNCSICLDIYTDPKLLQCFHVYCKKCLVPLVDRDQHGKLGVSCPTCRQITPISGRGVSGLQSAFHIRNLLEIQQSFRKVEKSATVPVAAIAATTAMPMAAGVSADHDMTFVKKNSYCPVHRGKELELYCETCEKLVCYKCTFKNGEHHSHNCEEIYKAFGKYKIEIMSLLDPMEERATTFKKALGKLDARCGEISDRKSATEDNIHGAFDQVREALSVRETNLVSQLDRIAKDKLKCIAAQKDQMEITLGQLSSCIHYMRESLRTGNEGTVLTVKTNLARQVKELSTPLKMDLLEPSAEADMVFSALTDATAVCQNYGLVLASGLPDYSQCTVTGKGAEEAIAGEKSSVILQVSSAKEVPTEVWESELVSEITGGRSSCTIEDRGDGQFKISYQPTIKGRHQLYVKAEGQHIRGSPFCVAVTQPVEKLDIPILSLGGVVKPWGVAINHTGEVVVTEHGGHSISVFSSRGEKLRSFGTCGSGKGEFWYPRGITVDGEGNLLVADCYNDRIQKFTVDGCFFEPVGTNGSAPLQFCLPTDIVFNPSNSKIYVADSNNNRVQVLNSDLTFSSMFGRRGTDRGQFNSPWGIACDSTGKVFVADSDNHRVQVFTAKGEFMTVFGRRGQGRGELYGPLGFAVHSSGLAYISEGDNHRISIFNSKHEFVTSFGRRGVVPGSFNVPCGLAVDESGIVYVCDRDNNRVQVF